MISKRHWLVAGGLAVSLHAVAFYSFFYQPTEGSKAPGYQGIEFDLGMMGDMGASNANRESKKQIAKVEVTQKVVEPEPKKDKQEEPKPVVEKEPTPEPEKAPDPKPKPKPEPEPTPPPKEVVKEKPVIKPQPVVKEKQKSPIAIPKKEPKKELKKESKKELTEQVQEKPKKEVVKKVEPKKVEPKPTPKNIEPTPKKAAPTEKKVAKPSQAEESDNSGSTAQTSRKATTGVGNTATSGGNKGATASYYTQLAAVLAQNKRYPRASRRRNEEGVVTVSFVAHADGQITNTDIIKSSGYRRLDNAVLDMLKRATPLPKFSSDMKESQLAITLPVSFKLSDY